MNREAQPLKCNGCRTTENVIRYPGRHRDPYCPDCAEEKNRYDAARESLPDFLKGALQPWLAHWMHRGLTMQEVGEIIGVEAGELGATYVRIAKSDEEGAE